MYENDNNEHHLINDNYPLKLTREAIGCTGKKTSDPDDKTHNPLR